MLYRKIEFIFCALFCPFICSAQNYVINPSFEQKSSCPTGSSQIDTAIGWTSFRQTPDYFDSCNLFGVGVPNNTFGYQVPFDGSSYAGLILYRNDTSTIRWREYLGSKLSISLTLGKKIFISAYIVRANGIFTHGACNNFGFKFFTSAFSVNNPCSMDNYCHLRDTVLRTDSINWTKISGSFIPDSAYEFFAMGNFFDDQNTDTIDMHNLTVGNPTSAYYFIDYVCITDDSLALCDILLNQAFLQNQLTDFTISQKQDQLQLRFFYKHNSKVHCNLFDINARKILEKEIQIHEGINYEFIPCGNWADGVYVVEVAGEEFLQRAKVLVNH